MLEIHITEDSRGRLSSLFARGHADFAIQSEDVICAAVSAILQAAYAGLEDVAKLRFDGKRAPGELLIRIPQEARDRTDVAAIVRTAAISVEQIARQHPEYVRVTYTAES
jgi:uncharacterized protein YsxB (DUF464 family)